MTVSVPDAFVPVLTVMADYGNAPFLWLVDSADRGGVGSNICDGVRWYPEDPLSEGLWSDFAEWAIRFDRTCFYLDDVDPGDWDWIAFHTQGLRLAQRLKVEVGERFRVVYTKPSEDPNHRRDSRREILIDGTMISLPSFRAESTVTQGN